MLRVGALVCVSFECMNDENDDDESSENEGGKEDGSFCRECCDGQLCVV